MLRSGLVCYFGVPYRTSQHLSAKLIPVLLNGLQSRCFAKGKKQEKFKKSRTIDAYVPHTVPVRRVEKIPSNEKYKVGADDDSKQKFSGEEIEGIFVACAGFCLAVILIARSYRPRPNPSPKAKPARQGVDLETLSKKHKLFTEMWKDSPAYRDLAALFEDDILDNDRIKITACMCLCLGTLSGPSWLPNGKSYNSSMSQLVAFESMVELLRKSTFCKPKRLSLIKDL